LYVCNKKYTQIKHVLRSACKKTPLLIKYILIINMLLFIQVDKIVKESLNNAKNKKLKDKEIKLKANFRR